MHVRRASYGSAPPLNCGVSRQGYVVKYIQPELKKPSFTCPHCGVLAQVRWAAGWERNGPGFSENDLHIGYCTHCDARTIWFMDEFAPHMIWPIGIANAPLPHDDMPDDVKADYVEARSICTSSPRGAAALLRLSIQKLCKHLGESGANINADIGALVKKGLPIQIQKALDVVRVSGNNAVHPGELDLNDKPEIATALFGLVNLIVDNRIAEPKRIDALYGALPSGAIESIGKRDA
jgi:hypothetical protein